MLLEQISSKKKNTWIKYSKLFNIPIWEILEFNKIEVYIGKYWIGNQNAISLNKNCRYCNTPFNIKSYKNNFFINKNCSCATDGTKLMNKTKLMVYVDEIIADFLIQSVNSKKTSKFLNTESYWKKLGYDDIEIKNNIKTIQKNRSELSPASKKNAKGYSSRTIEYWNNRGFSEAEAKQIISKLQIKNGLTYYINKYGAEKGTAAYNERIDNWLKNINKLNIG
jgi:hypothetical protein